MNKKAVLFRALSVVATLVMVAVLALDTHIILSEMFGQGQSGSTARAELREEDGDMKTIYLAGGCFWGVQKFFDQFDGVFSTEVGYAN